jgi:hypothetical protein
MNFDTADYWELYTYQARRMQWTSLLYGMLNKELKQWGFVVTTVIYVKSAL